MREFIRFLTRQKPIRPLEGNILDTVIGKPVRDSMRDAIANKEALEMERKIRNSNVLKYAELVEKELDIFPQD
jgi:hypothetical protein